MRAAPPTELDEWTVAILAEARQDLEEVARLLLTLATFEHVAVQDTGCAYSVEAAAELMARSGGWPGRGSAPA